MNNDQIQQKILSSQSEPQALSVTLKPAKAIGWGCIFLFLFGAVASYLDGEGNVSPFFLLFSMIGVALVLVTGEFSASTEQISYSTPIAKYQMKWSEVKKVEIDLQNGGLVFYGESRNTRMAVLGPMYWSGDDARELLELVFDEIEKRQIILENTPKASGVMSKNTRMR